MALGLNIVVGYAGLLDLGYVAFWAIGGYTGGWLMSGFIFKAKVKVGGSALPTAQGVHISFWAVLIIAGLVCAFMGIIIGAPTLRLKSDYLAIVTLGFGEIILSSSPTATTSSVTTSPTVSRASCRSTTSAPARSR